MISEFLKKRKRLKIEKQMERLIGNCFEMDYFLMPKEMIIKWRKNLCLYNLEAVAHAFFWHRATNPWKAPVMGDILKKLKEFKDGGAHIFNDRYHSTK